jgi:hypothetical protein
VLHVVSRMFTADRTPSIYRSKFNTPLGIGAQGFCAIR